MENAFLNFGLSWTLAKVLPYLLSILFGLLPLFFLKRMRKLFRLAFIPIPFIIYFAFFPIYEGDFSNSYTTKSAESLNILEDGKLSVLSIPGCPYCYESLDALEQMAGRQKAKLIQFYVYTNDAENLNWYSKKAGDKIPVIQLNTSELGVSAISKGSFPCFVYRKGNKLYIWSNNAFGVRAKDWIENEWKK